VTTPTELARARATPARRSDRTWTLIRWSSPLVLLALWQLGSALGLIPQAVLPAPSLIAEAGVELIENGQLVDAHSVAALGLYDNSVNGR